MSLSKNQKIGILAILATLLTSIGVTIYVYSPEIILSEFNPPNEINYNSGGVLHFELTNYGEKTGSYLLSIESEKFLISKKLVNNLDDDYKHNFSMNYLMPKDSNVVYNFYIKVDKTNLKPTANISLIYVDRSGFNPFKKEHTWNFYYKLDSSNNYQLINEEYFKTTIFLIR